MRAIKNYFWNLVIFLITPFLHVVIDSLGVEVSYSGPASREYSRSVTQRANVVVILYTLFLVMFLVSNTMIAAVLVSVPLFIVCITILTPQVLLSYETWNWWKIASLQRQFRNLRQGDCENGELYTLILSHLARELMAAEMNGHHFWHRFDHIFHLFRTLEYWKKTRKELFDLCSIKNSEFVTD